MTQKDLIKKINSGSHLEREFVKELIVDILKKFSTEFEPAGCSILNNNHIDGFLMGIGIDVPQTLT